MERGDFMSKGYSNVTFLGNVVRDPVCKKTPNGKFYCRFSIAIENRYKREDEFIKATEFFNLVAWERLAQYCEKQIKQGTRIFVVASPKNYKPEDSKYNIVFFTISYLNIENNRKNTTTKAGTDPQTIESVTSQTTVADDEETPNKVPSELPEGVEAMHDEEIEEYDYFDEEDYSEL